jgi:GMP synthase (glutamine-hydrolysing)
MKEAIVLQHADFEGPGRIAALLESAGYEVEIRALHRGDPVPARMNPESLLVVMGGSMGVADIGRPEFPFLEDEVRLLGRRVDQDSPVLGVCLGAQLLAHAAGSRVYPMAARGGGLAPFEVGWAPVRFHLEGGDDTLVGVAPEAYVLHWHGDMFDVPAGAKLLASSAICSNQAFRLGRRLFGLQFHCEVDAGNVEAFLRSDGDFVVRANGPEGVARVRAMTAIHVQPSMRTGDTFLGNILRAMTDPHRAHAR